MSKKHEKATDHPEQQVAPCDVSTAETEVQPAPSNPPAKGGSLAAKIVQLSVSDLREGDEVLYPGNKVIPVESVQSYTNRYGDELFVVKFKGQPAQVYLAFEVDATLYVYKR
jgi:hypothetical protein